MATTAHPKSKKFADLPASERARRINNIKDPTRRKKAQKFWGVSEPDEKYQPATKTSGLSGRYAPAVSSAPRDRGEGSKPKPVKQKPSFMENLIGDVPQLGKALYHSSIDTGEALLEDARKGRGLAGGARYAIQRTGGPFFPYMLAAEKAGIISAPKGPYHYKSLSPRVWDPKAKGGQGGFIDERESNLSRIGKETARAIPGQIKMIADPHAWYEDPLIQIFNVGSLVLPAARATSVMRLSRSFRAANPKMTLSQANKAAIVETFHPGFMAGQEVKGGIPKRIIKGRYGSAEGRMPSRGPIPRAVIGGYDKASEAIDRSRPGNKLSSSQRAKRMSQRASNRAVRRQKAKDLQAITEVANAITPGGSRQRRIREFFDFRGKTSPERAAALIAGLEGPEGISLEEAAKLKVAVKEDILRENVDLRERQDEIDDLRRQHDEDPDPEQQRYLMDEIVMKQDALDFDLGQRIPEVRGSRVRSSILSAMRRSIGQDEALNTISLWDAVARSVNPENPAAWYDSKLSGARVAELEKWSPEGATQFQTGRYTPDPEGQTTPRIKALIDAGQKDPEEIAMTLVDEDEAFSPGGWEEFGFSRNDAISEYLHSIESYELRNPWRGDVLFRQGAGESISIRKLTERQFYFPISRVLNDLGSKPVQAGQLLKRLKDEGVPDSALERSGLDSLAENKSEMVNPAEIEDRLLGEGYYDANDAEVTVLREGAGTQYGPAAYPDLNSRSAAPGEYFEMTVRLPEGRSRTAAAHWAGDPRVVYHVRYQVFVDENGNRVLLIDELQSDLASDHRRATKFGQAADQTADDFIEAKRARDKAVEDADQALADASRAQREHTLAFQAKRQAGDTSHESYNAFLDEGRRYATAVDLAKEELKKAGEARSIGEYMAPMESAKASPMGNRYLSSAVHNLMSEADDHDVDMIVISDGGTQAVRNGNVDPVKLKGVEYSRSSYSDLAIPGQEDLDWVHSDTLRPVTTQELTKMLRDEERMTRTRLLRGGEEMVDMEGNPVTVTQSLGGFPRRYNEEVPKLFKKLYGVDHEWTDAAYRGYYSTQNAVEGGVKTADSWMPGTVIRLTDEVRAKAREKRPIQHRRGDQGVPQGATEWLADGRARVTMFETANVTTWVHELAHVALHDLPPEDLAKLEKTIAEGRKLADWTEADHEKFARSFETYLRDGHAAPALQEIFAKITTWMKQVWDKSFDQAEEISPETADVFDRMLGRRYQNTVVLDDAQINQVRAEIADLQKALDSGELDSPQFERAIGALQELADKSELAGAEILLRNSKGPEQSAAIMEGLSRRKNAVVEDYRRRGLVGYGEEARGYFPHLSMWEALGAPRVEATRMGAIGDVVGTPRIPSKAVNRNRNRLVRHQTGEVLNDPAALVYIYRARLRLLETIKARTELFVDGDPIKKGETLPEGSVAYVRDPEIPPEKLQAATTAAQELSREDFSRLSARQREAAIEEVTSASDSVINEMVWVPGKSIGEKPAWVTDEPSVRTVPLGIAKTRLGDVFPTGPRGNIGAGFGIANSLARAASIYLPFWRYVPINFAQNAVMLAMTNPGAFEHLLTRRMKELTDGDPEMRNMIREEVGTIQATALPEYSHRAQGKMQRAERTISKASGQAGEILGKWADVPIREASWLKHAEKYGFSSKEEIRKLLTDDDLETTRNTISQRVKEDLIDFDALNPWEKEVLSRYFFLWPFIRGITKWPLMYAREYPGRIAGASLLSNAVNEENVTGSVHASGIANIMGRAVNVGKFDPTGPGREAMQMMMAMVRANQGVFTDGDAPNLEPLASEYLAPQYKELINVVTGRGGSTFWDRVGGTFVPGAKLYSDIKKGGSWKDQLLRQERLTEEASASTHRDVNEWMGKVEKLEKKMTDAGVPVPAAVSKLKDLRAPYAEWKQYENQSQFNRRDQGLSETLPKADRIVGLLHVAKTHFPELYAQANASVSNGGWKDMEELVTSDKATQDYLDVVDRLLYDQMFGKMEDVMRDAKKAGWVDD